MSQHNSNDLADRLEALGHALREHSSLADRVLQELDTLETHEAKPSEAEVALPSLDSEATTKLGDNNMFRRYSYGGLAVGLLIAVAFWAILPGQRLLLAQVVEQLQRVKDYQCDVVMLTGTPESDGEQPALKGTFYWRSPASMRTELQGDGDTPEASPMQQVHSSNIILRDGPGLRIDHLKKTYQITSAKQGQSSPLMALPDLARFRGKASKELGAKLISGKQCTGFEIDFADFDRSMGEGKMILWVDNVTQLPALVELELDQLQAGMRLENFRWNQGLQDRLFDTTPPQGYANKTAAPKEPSKIAEHIIEALKLYSELDEGNYPPYDMIYGDVMMSRCRELAGYAGRDPKEYLREEKYARLLKSSHGWAHMNQILAADAKAVYRGKSVSPGEEDKVLFAWQLPNGSFQVILGDLSVRQQPQLSNDF